MNSMYDRVKAYIEKNCMLEGIGRVVVGLSGGADSVCLLLMLKKYITETRKGCGTQLMAVHVHHGIRGAEADSDAAFCKALCEEQGIEYREYCYDVPRLAKERGCGEEEMGRLLRYGAFRENIDNLPMGIKGAAAVADSSGYLPAEASTDGVHLNKEYCGKWLDYLKNHTAGNMGQ